MNMSLLIDNTQITASSIPGNGPITEMMELKDTISEIPWHNTVLSQIWYSQAIAMILTTSPILSKDQAKRDHSMKAFDV